jgi:hypothetical protein
MNEKNGLSKYRQRKAMQAFCAGLTASRTALLLGLSRNTVNRYFGAVPACHCGASGGTEGALRGGG